MIVVARIIILCPCYRSSVNHEAWMSEKIHHITNGFASELIFHKTYRPLVRITRSRKLFSIQINKWSEINKYRLHIRLFCWIWFPFTKLISCCCRITRGFDGILYLRVYISPLSYIRSGFMTDINTVKTSSRCKFGMPYVTRRFWTFQISRLWLDEALARRSADVLSTLCAAGVINEAKQSIVYLPLQIT